MLVTSLALYAAQASFADQVYSYIACVEGGLPTDYSAQDHPSRIILYRAAAVRCRTQREAAIAAAVRDRKPDQSAEQARALAIDIIDTLDPGSN